MANGLVLIDKPQGITSFDVVAKVRKKLNTKKVGHAGTLDPMATGLMLVGVGQGTKLLNYLVGLDKQYLATIRLGMATVSDDAEGELVSRTDASSITEAQVDSEIANLRGVIDQIPSSVSAKKIDGKRAYDLVRQGVEVELKPKRVTISNFQRTSPLRFDAGFCDVDVVVDCSSGTYIRALARDIGDALGVGGHLIMLRRTRIGDYLVSDAQALESEMALTTIIDSVEKLMPVRKVTGAEEVDVYHGKPLELDSEQGVVALVRERLIAISSPKDGKLRSEVVFAKEAND
jgi:tRNA pseudouridine55 synthase